MALQVRHDEREPIHQSSSAAVDLLKEDGEMLLSEEESIHQQKPCWKVLGRPTVRTNILLKTIVVARDHPIKHESDTEEDGSCRHEQLLLALDDAIRSRKRRIFERLMPARRDSDHRRRRRSSSRTILQLEHLHLESSDFDSIETEFGSALQLYQDQVSLSHNPLRSLPDCLGEFRSLRVLHLSQCQLSNDIWQSHEWQWPFLEELYLDHNRLTEFPDESVCDGLPNLQVLQLRNNRLSSVSIPPNTLRKLEELDLGVNDLMYFPERLEQQQSLKVLRLDHNVLSTVPNDSLPLSLRTLEVSWNPLTEPPMEVCASGIRAIRRYWSDKDTKR